MPELSRREPELRRREPELRRRERTPPLPWIRAFESAARQGSFLGAGRELSVSAAAVSRSIKELERSIGVDLFMRRACGVELTPAGRTYASALTPALRQIAHASAEVKAAARQASLRLSSPPALALIPPKPSEVEAP
ncbi:MAG TPA: LysR family transcriptional regulator [Steroidobacteraceae bacterium]|jgi:LysR family glycine cleavage system transcriptional activator|nr:LysR family transcriptional regulator [Steroidobacteraceae bacterium]